MNTVIVFTLRGCEHCVDLKNKLFDESIQFVEIIIDDNEEIWNQVVNQTGYNLLPTVYIEIKDTEEGPVFVPERDFNSPEELIEKVKKYYNVEGI